MLADQALLGLPFLLLVAIGDLRRVPRADRRAAAPHASSRTRADRRVSRRGSPTAPAAAPRSRGPSRRSFLQTTALVGTALAVAPTDFVLRPGSAYARALQRAAAQNCACGSLCCDGYTEFCCTMTGAQRLPAGHDRRRLVEGRRLAVLQRAPLLHRLQRDLSLRRRRGSARTAARTRRGAAGARNGDCNNRKAGCTQFRYGQCNQQVATVGRIACRVVSCDPAVLVVGNCAPTLAVDNSTANHNKPCLQAPTPEEADVEHGMAVDVVINPQDPTSGYTLDRWGGVHPFGERAGRTSAAYWPGQDVARRLVVTDWNTPAGYVMDLDGGMHPFGGAPRLSRHRRTGSGGKIVAVAELSRCRCRRRSGRVWPARRRVLELRLDVVAVHAAR